MVFFAIELFAGNLAYVGPGAGLTMIGSLLAVFCFIVVALLAPLILFVRLCAKLVNTMLTRSKPQTVSVVDPDLHKESSLS